MKVNRDHINLIPIIFYIHIYMHYPYFISSKSKMPSFKQTYRNLLFIILTLSLSLQLLLLINLHSHSISSMHKISIPSQQNILSLSHFHPHLLSLSPLTRNSYLSYHCSYFPCNYSLFLIYTPIH